MATIDKLDLSVYNLYALRTKMLEQINQELRLDQAASIPPQTQVLNVYPKLSELDLLLGVVPYVQAWAYFYEKEEWRYRRRSPFSFYRVAPTIGTLEEQEQLEDLIDNLPVHTDEEREEKMILQKCFKELDKINSWLGYIIGRLGQFLQG